MGFSRQEYWGGLLFPSPGDLPDPGIKPTSRMSTALAGRFFTNCTAWEAPIRLPPSSSWNFSSYMDKDTGREKSLFHIQHNSLECLGPWRHSRGGQGNNRWNHFLAASPSWKRKCQSLSCGRETRISSHSLFMGVSLPLWLLICLFSLRLKIRTPGPRLFTVQHVQGLNHTAQPPGSVCARHCHAPLWKHHTGCA